MGRRGRAAELSPKPDENPYRSDLAAVVRPRRPEAGAGAAGPRSVRPDEPRPAPLKLVAEQQQLHAHLLHRKGPKDE